METIKQTFGTIGTEFINIYSENNPILNSDDNCYFLFSNIYDYHRPLIGSGTIIHDKFNDGLNKQYYIKLENIHESPLIIEKFVNNKTFDLVRQPSLDLKKSIQVTSDRSFVFETNLFKVDAFFVRTNIDDAKQLQTDYIDTMRSIIMKQLRDTEQS